MADEEKLALLLRLHEAAGELIAQYMKDIDAEVASLAAAALKKPGAEWALIVRTAPARLDCVILVDGKFEAWVFRARLHPEPDEPTKPDWLRGVVDGGGAARVL